MPSTLETRLFINGEFVNAKSGKTFALKNPANGSKIADIQAAGAEDVEAAVVAAEKAQPAWEAAPAHVRAACLTKLAGLVRAKLSELAEVDALAMGRPISTNYDAMLGAGALEYVAGLAQNVHGHSSLMTPGQLNFTVKQPYGVTCGIIPWNVPIIMFLFKIGPATAAGNAIIIKSSEKSPLSGAILAGLCHEAGFPPGIVQCLSGLGETGKLLAEHMRVRKVAFTGSTRTGRFIMAAAAQSNLKAVTLELGGKSPTIIFDDADIKTAVQACSFSIQWNAGQVCMANSRLYVHENVYDEFTQEFSKLFGQFKHGDPLDKETTLGPQADELQAKAVQSYLDIGHKEGKAILGGHKPDPEGFYFNPTIFTDVPETSRINKEEVFGPVVIIHKFTEEADVLARANDSEYGLYAAVYTKDIDRAIRVAKGLQAGTVGVNCTSPTGGLDMPFGGFKTSGVGREGGPHGLEHWLEEKAIVIKVAPA